MATIREILAASIEHIHPVSESPELDAELLLCDALDCTRTQLLTKLDDVMPQTPFESHLQRRLNHEPVAHIVQLWEFFSLPIAVESPTLVPRPETEVLVECALELMPKGECHALDIGTGTGCIPIAIAKNHPGVRFVSVDIKTHNLELAARNAAMNTVSDRIEFLESDVLANVGDRGPFDFICSNPPYISDTDWPRLAPDIQKHEDRDALTAGVDGLDIVRRIIIEAPEHLVAGGHLVMEIGHDQAESVSVLLEENGYTDVGFRKDIAGIHRVILGRKRV